MDYLVVTNIKCITKITNSEFEEDSLDETIGSFKDELSALLKKNGFELKSIENAFIETQKYSVCKCDSCGVSMINRDNNPIGYNDDFIEDVILNGGESEGKILCENCLPRNHRWSL